MERPDRKRRGVCAALAMALAGSPAAYAAAPPLRLVDALHRALSANPDLQVQQAATEAARGQLQQATGQFDTVLGAGAEYARQQVPSPLPGALQGTTYSAGYRAGARKQLRSGPTLGASLDAKSYQDSALPGAQAPATVTLGVTLNLPLLRGRGGREVAAIEDAASLQLQASELALRDSAAQALHRTLSAYWAYAIQFALEQVARDSEQRSRELLASTQKLVDAAEKPRGDLVLLQADLADRVASRQAAALALSEARIALGRLLGMDGAAIAALAAPADALPAILAIGMPAEAQLIQLRTAARQRRPDLAALGAQVAAAQRQTEAAQHRLLPDLNLQLGVGYAKAHDGSNRYPWWGEAGRVQHGASLSARLVYEFPLQNNAARGTLRERAAQLEQAALRQRDLEAAVAAGIDSAVASLATRSAQLQVAQQALALYERAVGQEMVKQKNGIATLIDVINVESRFINARTSYLQTYLAYAQAMARLRYESGTLLPVAGTRFELDPAELAGLGPLASQLAPPP
ncbi:TolC family protein [Pseudoduganella sp. DS3]|uniref:TolC family protein n=1 Tax=Pseudoduganella guangdongensis TaxID=2692179 RepID=A0A6N9HKR5_9BURK|nr:TolC family protein [Pseudoduganella guangdongensis]MYN04194.1 TolC family protein [Pseudoduganella guangdongensis]